MQLCAVLFFFLTNLINIIRLSLRSSFNNPAFSLSSYRDHRHTNGVQGRHRIEEHADEARRWTESFLPAVLSRGSIALSCSSDLGLTSALEQLASVSSASFTISRKLYPTVSSTQAHTDHVTQLLFSAQRNPLKLLGWEIASPSCDGFLLKDDMSGKGFKGGRGWGWGYIYKIKIRPE